ncbi:MAG: T9SS type A sorting domain-containing protein [Flavobacteriaceae bacterium]|nr:T9SS type A sorting domain-containing protein [Flavobacteriaceae bacterium]
MKKITLLITIFLCHLVSAQNIVINGDFSDDLNSWQSYEADFVGVSASFSAANNEANITNINGAGDQVWHVQFNQVLTANQITSLEVGESYKISFSARSNVNNRQLRLFFGQDGGDFTDLIIEDFTINTTMDTYEVIFNVGQTFDTMKLGFETGLSNDDVFIDDVVLEQNVIDPLTNANLSELFIDSAPLPDFNANVTAYSFGLGVDSTIPEITGATPANPNASLIITQADSLPGEASVLVTAEDGETTKTYTLSFVIEGPTIPAPTPPERDAENVLSIFSDAYSDIIIDDFDFGLCANVPAVEEVTIDGNPTQRYLGPGCQGIDFQNNKLDASTFTNIHFDFYTDEVVDGAVFNIKLVDWAGNDTDVSSTGLEVLFNVGTDPALVENQWVSVDVIITELGGMVLGDLTRSDVAQIHITSNLPNVWYDNFYLSKDPGTCDDGIQNQNETGIDCGGPCEPCSGPPTVAAPTPPARPASDVISIFSDAYDDVTLDDFDFGLCANDPATEEILIAENPTILYSGPGCQGIDFQNNRFDATDFSHLHFDFYTDEEDLVGKVFNIKLVDWAGNETDEFSTGLEVIFNTGTDQQLVANEWVSVDVDINALGGMVLGNLTRSDVAQIHITSNLDNVWYDNLYLHKATFNTIEFEKQNISIYPNPASTYFNIRSDVEFDELRIYNTQGKVLLHTKNPPERINTSNLKAGIYLIQFTSGKQSLTKRLIIK